MAKFRLHRKMPWVRGIYARLVEARRERDECTAQLGQMSARLELAARERDSLAAEIRSLASGRPAPPDDASLPAAPTVTLNAELTAKIEQLERLCFERTAQLDELSKQSAMDRPLAFMHIPKTSGKALAAGLREILPRTACVVGIDRWALGPIRSSETLPPKYIQMISEGLPPANGSDFVSGHIAYSTLIQSRPAARLMTVLREPRSRILSHWMFWRSHSDETLANYGAWERIVRLARRPLIEFLNHPQAAYVTDNVAARMLLSPHPLIPDDGFIDSASDEHLASEAAARLKAFDFADIVENPRLEDNVRAFLARPFVHRRVNETPALPSELRVSVEEELTSDAVLRLEHLSRLDGELWRAVVAGRIDGADPRALSDDTFRRTVIRHAALIRPGSTG